MFACGNRLKMRVSRDVSRKRLWSWTSASQLVLDPCLDTWVGILSPNNPVDRDLGQPGGRRGRRLAGSGAIKVKMCYVSLRSSPARPWTMPRRRRGRRAD